jgi:lysozyme
MMMKMSEHGLKLLKEWEGQINHVYRDSAGYPTIGIGHLLTDVEKTAGHININDVAVDYSNGITDQQCLDLLAQDVTPAEHAVIANVTCELNQNQFDALVSFTFNIGVGAFASSTLVKLLNEGQYNQVPTQLMRWTKAGGKECDGLMARRSNESKLWEGEI